MATPPITLGAWEVHSDRVYLDGERTRLTRMESCAVYAVAAGKGEFVSTVEVGGFTCPSSDDPRAIGNVYLRRARQRMPSLPIEARPYFGYRWVTSPEPYTGPYPIRTHRNEAEIAAGDDALLRRLEYASRDVERLTAEAVARGLLKPNIDREAFPPPCRAFDGRRSVVTCAPAAPVRPFHDREVAQP